MQYKSANTLDRKLGFGRRRAGAGTADFPGLSGYRTPLGGYVRRCGGRWLERAAGNQTAKSENDDQLAHDGLSVEGSRCDFLRALSANGRRLGVSIGAPSQAVLNAAFNVHETSLKWHHALGYSGFCAVWRDRLQAKART